MRRSNEFQAVIDAAVARGWSIIEKSACTQLRHPNGGIVHASKTPSDWRAPRKLERDLRLGERGQMGRAP